MPRAAAVTVNRTTASALSAAARGNTVSVHGLSDPGRMRTSRVGCGYLRLQRCRARPAAVQPLQCARTCHLLHSSPGAWRLTGASARQCRERNRTQQQRATAAAAAVAAKRTYLALRDKSSNSVLQTLRLLDKCILRKAQNGPFVQAGFAGTSAAKYTERAL